MRERRNIPDALGPSPVSSNQISLIPYLPYLPPLTYTYLFLFLCRATLLTYINSEMKLFWSRPSSFLYSFSSLSSFFPLSLPLINVSSQSVDLSINHSLYFSLPLSLLSLSFSTYFPAVFLSVSLSLSCPIFFLLSLTH